MKGFYSLPKTAQWIIASLMMVIGFGGVTPLLIKPYGILLLPVLAPIMNLVSVPFLKLVGYYKYLNPYVISTIQTNDMYDLHNIFTFDYLVNFKWTDRGLKVQKTLLLHYLKALLTVIHRIENEGLSPEVKIVGHSYFFNERTATRVGFTVSKASSFWVINSCLQFIELSYLYSFSQGKLALPKFWKVKRVEIIGKDLVEKKEVIAAMVERLS